MTGGSHPLLEVAYSCDRCDAARYNFVRPPGGGGYFKFPPTIGARERAALLFVGINPRRSHTNLVLHRETMASFAAFSGLADNRIPHHGRPTDSRYIRRRGPEPHYEMHMDLVEAVYGRGAHFEDHAAVTELFLCANAGLPSALVRDSPCAQRYLAVTIAHVRPEFVLPVGSAAGEYLRGARISGIERIYRVRIAEHEAWVIGLPHPNRRGLTRQARDAAVRCAADAIREIGTRPEGWSANSAGPGLRNAQPAELSGTSRPGPSAPHRPAELRPSSPAAAIGGSTRSLGTREVERLGLAALTEMLQGERLRVKEGSGDVDLFVIPAHGQPVAIQMVAAADKSFSVRRRHGDIPGLVMVYVWNLASPQPTECYALRWAEVRLIADRLGWTATKSWTQGGYYMTSKPSQKVKDALRPHRMTPGNWQRLFERTAS